MPPSDPFKDAYFAKEGLKEVPTKINSMIHCSDEALMRGVDVQAGYRHKMVWTTGEKDTRCVGTDRTFRTFDKIVAKSVAYENNELNREKKLQEYHA